MIDFFFLLVCFEYLNLIELNIIEDLGMELVFFSIDFVLNVSF